MNPYRKAGYLHSNFKMFHLTDTERNRFSCHYHDFYKILLLLSGDVTYHIEGRAYELLPNDIVLVHSGEVHKPVINSCSPYERIILYVAPDFLNAYLNEAYDLGLCFARAHKEQSHVLRLRSFEGSRLHTAARALENSIADRGYAAELYRESLFLTFMIELNRAALNDDVSYISNTASNETILSILEYINGHLTEELDIDHLAERFFLSRYYLMHSFKEETGYTIGNYISAKRLLLAKELILTGKPITEVCYACGYKNYSTFSRAYKKHFHEAPKSLRTTTKNI